MRPGFYITYDTMLSVVESAGCPAFSGVSNLQVTAQPSPPFPSPAGSFSLFFDNSTKKIALSQRRPSIPGAGTART